MKQIKIMAAAFTALVDAAAVYVNASYVALHNANAGRRTIRLPSAARVTELFPGSRLVSKRCSEFSFETSGTATTIFLVEK